MLSTNHIVRFTDATKNITATLEPDNSHDDPLEKMFGVHGYVTVIQGGHIIAQESFTSYDHEGENGERSWDWRRCTIQSVEVDEKERAVSILFVGPCLCGPGSLEKFKKTLRLM
ncbi:MAG: hypothetical protein OYG31_01455 [Candidatus Kaiserbacteria bacterium]|nr:hypothetical protein [Candidatus Kaiserbacteria bacterium]